MLLALHEENVEEHCYLQIQIQSVSDLTEAIKLYIVWLYHQKL